MSCHVCDLLLIVWSVGVFSFVDEFLSASCHLVSCLSVSCYTMVQGGSLEAGSSRILEGKFGSPS